ncbi:MAG: MFS transporter [Betaproteobacteria bacterium]|nr:MFS transporter [Betaproteobacteria bacterium]
MPPSAAVPRIPHELPLLLTLAAVQFTHVVDFMIMMPLGPQFMRLFAIGPQQFGFMVSAYTFAAAASGFVAAFWVDRFDRRRALLGLYAGFIVATALCGMAPDYPLLLTARVVAGAFGGILGGFVFAIVADLVPYARRATATAIVAAAFSLAAVAGVPLSISLAAHFSWRAPFLAVAALSVAVGLAAMRLIPPLTGHVEAGARRRPRAQLRAIFGVANHRRAFVFMIVLMCSVFTIVPFLAAYNVANVGVAEADLAVIYFAGGATSLITAQVIGRLADRYGKRRLFTILALISIGPILVVTHLPPLPLGWVVAMSVLFFVFVPGRFGPATALVTGSVEPRLRGSFMSFNASIQQFASGIASLTAGFVIGRAPDGTLTHFGAVGWLSVGCTLCCLWLVRRIRVVDGGAAVTPTVP